MATNKPERTKDQLIIDPVLTQIGEIIERLTKEKEGLVKENNKLRVELAEKMKKAKN